MGSTKVKFAVGSIIIVVALGWLAVTGFQETKSYYKTVDELTAMKDRALGLRLRVAGEIVPGSIVRRGQQVEFRLTQNGQEIPVSYIGREALPDTFVDGAQAVCDGSYVPDGAFQAKKIQAKCSSKYEAEYRKTQS